jgi:hypothetical protein
MYIRADARDNVAIIIHPDGAARSATLPGGLIAREPIPQSHKVALSDLARGDIVMRYGHPIGCANRSILAGSWVREEFLDMPTPPPLDDLPLATAVPAPLPPLAGYTFEGYRNADGSTGTRNILGIATTVQCVAPTVDYAARHIKAELLPRFPNVDDVVAITHSYGCGVAIDAPGAAIPIRTLKHISLHANLAGEPLVVSLGCEKLQPVRLFGNDLPILSEPNIIRLQDQRGFAETVSALLEAAEKRLERLDRSGGRAAVRRQRRVLRSHMQSGSGLCGRPAGAGRRDGPLLRSHRGAGRHPSAHAPRRNTRSGTRPDPRNALVRRVSGARLGRPQRQHNSGQQARRLGQHRREGAGQHRQVGQHGHPGRRRPWRKGHREGPGVCGHAGQRFHLRHAAACLDEPARFHHG